MIPLLRSHLQKAPFLLAIFAWLMQLSVFITPILVKNPELGFGVCQELAVVVNHSSMAMNHMMNGVEHQMHVASSSTSSDKTIKKPIHSLDANCKFCLVLGHTFDPILLACLILLLAVILKITILPLAIYIFRLHQKLYVYLFQNRAPPFLLC